MHRKVVRTHRLLTWPAVVGLALVLAALAYLWLANDPAAGWTVGNFR